ncbi:hypothetical protein [Meiothermus sp.]|uniref:hypothetical protein n=1 Tax=Meiothermus sp. TaxID=1955249 RepID=UPI0026065F58|nr:hypothetical protein [Meiothermus sp.]
MLVSYDRRLVQTHRRLADGTWRYETPEKSGALERPCLDTKLSLDEIYADTDLA